MLATAVVLHSLFTAGHIERRDLVFLAALAEIFTLLCYIVFLSTFVPSFAALTRATAQPANEGHVMLIICERPKWVGLERIRT